MMMNASAPRRIVPRDKSIPGKGKERIKSAYSDAGRMTGIGTIVMDENGGKVRGTVHFPKTPRCVTLAAGGEPLSRFSCLPLLIFQRAVNLLSVGNLY